MRRNLAEQVTFGGGGLDRDAKLRGTPEALIRAQRSPEAGTLIFWRGFCLMATPGQVARLPMDHPVLRHAAEAPIFLGRGEKHPIFAHDISAWNPDEGRSQEPGAGWAAEDLPHHPDLIGLEGFADLRRVMSQLSPLDAELAATAKGLYSWHATHRFCARCGHPTEMAEGGWQRSCPSCGGQHFPRTDPVVIMLVTHGNNVLLGRSPGWPEGMYSLLAGFVEPGESIEAAVRREVAEETAVQVGDVRYQCCQPWPFPNSLMFGCTGIASSCEIEVDPVEIEQAMWVPREEVALIFAGGHPVIRQPRKGAIAEYLLRNWLADTLD